MATKTATKKTTVRKATKPASKTTDLDVKVPRTWRIVTGTDVTEKRGTLATVQRKVNDMTDAVMKNGWTSEWSQGDVNPRSFVLTIRNSKGVEQKALGIVLVPAADFDAPMGRGSVKRTATKPKKTASAPAKKATAPKATAKTATKPQKGAQPAKRKMGARPLPETFVITDVTGEDATDDNGKPYVKVTFVVSRKIGTKTVKMPARGAWMCKDWDIAVRLANAIWDEVAVSDFVTKTDVNGNEYVGYKTNIFAKRLNADLKRAGY